MKLKLAALLLKLIIIHLDKNKLYPYITVKFVYFHLSVYKILNQQHFTTKCIYIKKDNNIITTY